MCQLMLYVSKQWLVTERAKAQWKRFRAMIDEAKAKAENCSVELSCTPDATAGKLGMLLLFSGKSINT